MKNHLKLLGLISVLTGSTFIASSESYASCPEKITDKDLKLNITSVEIGKSFKGKGYDWKVALDLINNMGAEGYTTHELLLDANGNNFPKCNYHVIRKYDQTLRGSIRFELTESQ